MADSTLAAIQTKVRRVTRSPSPSQLSNDDINQYINTFVLYDFPENIRLFSLRTTLTFYTQPGVDVYGTNTIVGDPLYNFQNYYIAIHQPVFMAGVPAFFTQWRDIFYGTYPQTNTIAMTQLYGDGATLTFTGNIFASPSLQNSIIFNSVDATGAAMILIDYPINNVMGNIGPTTDGLGNPSPTFVGTINYATGAFTITFPNPPAAQAPIWVENISYQPGRPMSMLYYNNEFTIRPVPDNVYAIQVEADIRPTELLSSGQSPQIEQWWQYIALGAAKKIFEDRMDTDSLAQLLPIYKEQENLVLRTTLTQQANERTITIYTQGKNYGIGGWFAGSWPY